METKIEALIQSRLVSTTKIHKSSALVFIVIQQAHAGLHALFLGESHQKIRLFIVFLWLLGVLGDALTTIYGLRTGVAQEINPIANYFFNLLSVELWMGLSIVLCLSLGSLTLTRPRYKEVYGLFIGLGIILASKLLITFHNVYVLWG